ncbi:MAG: hypothetical protein Q4D73_00905 [Actinomycetaceae bacterium]|nr:hypothetical protein [Actinomycetaceae bacterium]
MRLASFYAGFRAKEARLPFVLSYLLFVCFVLFSSITVSVYNGASFRELYRFVALANDEVAPITVSASNFDYQIFGYSIPIDDVSGKEPPSGLTKWMDSEEVAVSPALATHYPLGTQSPWGKVTGIISKETLSTPTEYFFYSRIPEFSSSLMEDLKTRGAAIPVGDTFSFRFWGIFASGYIGLLFVPALIVFIAASIMSLGAESQFRVYKRLYPGFSSVFFYLLGIVTVPVLVSIVFSTGVYAALGVLGIKIPYLNLEINYEDLAQSLLPSIEAYLILVALSIVVLFVVQALNIRKLPRAVPKGRIVTVVKEIGLLILILLAIAMFQFPNLPNALLDAGLVAAVIGTSLLAATCAVLLSRAILWGVFALTDRSTAFVSQKKVSANQKLLKGIITLITIVSLGAGAFQLRGQVFDPITEAGASLGYGLAGKVSEISKYVPYAENEKLRSAEIPEDFGDVVILGISPEGSKQVRKVFVKSFTSTLDINKLPQPYNVLISSFGEDTTLVTSEDEVLMSEASTYFVVNPNGVDNRALATLLFPRGYKVGDVGASHLVTIEMHKYFGYWHLILGFIGFIPLTLVTVQFLSRILRRNLGVRQAEESLVISSRESKLITFASILVPMSVIPIFVLGGYRVLASVFQRRIMYYPELDISVPIGLAATSLAIGIFVWFIAQKRA